MARPGWLALVGTFAVGTTATAAPTISHRAAATAAVVRAATPAPTVNWTHLFDRLTVPLGTVPSTD